MVEMDLSCTSKVPQHPAISLKKVMRWTPKGKIEADQWQPGEELQRQIWTVTHLGHHTMADCRPSEI